MNDKILDGAQMIRLFLLHRNRTCFEAIDLESVDPHGYLRISSYTSHFHKVPVSPIPFIQKLSELATFEQIVFRYSVIIQNAIELNVTSAILVSVRSMFLDVS